MEATVAADWAEASPVQGLVEGFPAAAAMGLAAAGKGLRLVAAVMAMALRAMAEEDSD